MGEADVRTSDYFEDNEFFADMENAYFFQGEQIIKPEYLQEANKELADTQSEKSRKIIRDNVKKYFNNTLLCIYVLEHQKNIDYHMVLRNMSAEAMAYQKQWEANRKLHEKAGDLAPGHEFISGMKKEDRFTPVLSLIVYYGQEKWNAAKSLHELLDMEQLPPTLKQYIENYHIHIFDYHDYDNFDMFHTELRQVFSFLKHSSDKKALQKLIAEHQEEYYNVSRKTCELIAVLTNSRELLKPELYENNITGGVNMCKALEDMKLEERQEGIQIGIFQTLCSFVKDGIINVSDAASRMQISEDDFIARMNEAGAP